MYIDGGRFNMMELKGAKESEMRLAKKSNAKDLSDEFKKMGY